MKMKMIGTASFSRREVTCSSERRQASLIMITRGNNPKFNKIAAAPISRATTTREVIRK